MKLLGLALLLIGSSAFAGTNGYELNVDLSLNGKHVASPRMTVKAGEKASITQKNGNEETFIDVVATEGSVRGHKGIMMNFTVGNIAKDGKRTNVSTPQILARENEKAVIEVGEKNGRELSLSVVATRKAL